MSLTGSSPGANKIKINITVRASGQGSLGGTATIKDGSKTLKSKLKISKGKVSFSAKKIKPGKHRTRSAIAAPHRSSPARRRSRSR